MENYKKEFIEFMVDCSVLRFGDFVNTIFYKMQILQEIIS